MNPEPVTTGWDLVGVVVEGEPIDVLGANPWPLEWRGDGTRIRVAHPSYPDQHHLLSVYRITDGEQTIPFAAGELSPNVWAFFVPWPEFRS